jgi:hypothetical protein
MSALFTGVLAALALAPGGFTTDIDNPYWPMTPGSRWVYRETDGHGGVQRDVVTVTSRTRVVDGVTVRVVHDVSTERGRLVEVTDDWYAQDSAGTIWYFGEATTEYRRGRPASTEGSWEAGVGGARAGIVRPARPRVGMRYRQEHAPGVAEDRARVLSRSERAEVPFGRFKRVLLTREDTPLEPRSLEYKLYARGVGPVLSLTVSGGSDVARLVRYERG